MASSVSSWSDRSEGSECPHHSRCCRETGGHMKINLPIFKDEGCHHVPKLKMRLDCISLCRVPRLYPPPIHHLIPTRVPERTGEELRDRCNLRQCAHHIRQTLQQCQGIRCFKPRFVSVVNGGKGDCIILGCLVIKAPSSPGSLIFRALPSRLSG